METLAQVRARHEVENEKWIADWQASMAERSEQSVGVQGAIANAFDDYRASSARISRQWTEICEADEREFPGVDPRWALNPANLEPPLTATSL